ncbi:MAG: PQQ-dependent sugar dehydrogenase, partial [Anaerolineales bacterium]|nr:PQQ-dependent sugar dehydrogenase [Anaerolineales bacterium]
MVFKRILPLFLGAMCLWLVTSSFAAVAPSLQTAPTADLEITLALVADGFSQPLGLVNSGIWGDERLFVLEKTGQIKVLLPDGTILPEPYLDISSLVSTNSERGLLGMAFHPNFAENGYFYLNYTRRVDGESIEDRHGDTVIARYHAHPLSNTADPQSETVILVVDQEFANHNGGDLVFGPDGYLYIALGDGGSGNDPNNRAQDLNYLLGSLIRILPEPYPDDFVTPGVEVAKCGRQDEPQRYFIPGSNPFYEVNGANGCSEIWAYGLRNPWRISFDRQTDDLYIADVGQNAWEEANFQPASSTGGENYGWRCYEGLHKNFDCADEIAQQEPFFEYDHDDGRSVTGGYVYRGSVYPAMNGHYFFADFISGRLWYAIRNGGDGWNVTTEGVFGGTNFSSFGEDIYGELYAVDYNGRLYRVREALGAQLTAAAPPYVVGDEVITYTLTLSNMGTKTLNGLVISNTIPAGATYISGGTLTNDVVTWTTPTLDPSAEFLVQWVVSATQTITNSNYTATAAELPT